MEATRRDLTETVELFLAHPGTDVNLHNDVRELLHHQ